MGNLDNLHVYPPTSIITTSSLELVLLSLSQISQFLITLTLSPKLSSSDLILIDVA